MMTAGRNEDRLIELTPGNQEVFPLGYNRRFVLAIATEGRASYAPGRRHHEAGERRVPAPGVHAGPASGDEVGAPGWLARHDRVGRR